MFCNPINLLPRGGALLRIQLPGCRARQPPLGAIHDRGHHLQIAEQFRSCSRGDFFLPLGFEEQPRILQNAAADRGRSAPPGIIQLAGFPGIAVMRGENGRHALAVLQALARHRHQKLHRHLHRNPALAHLLLDRLRQQFH